ncbi:MAG: hypothetical protein M0Z34_01775 [Nitrospiraceae bacterium]|nr:hypothetical protein [Nitrospiraceae bacterium]
MSDAPASLESDVEKLASGGARVRAGARDPLDFDLAAGILPQTKLALVERAQAAGHVVGTTGDGINDAPALSARKSASPSPRQPTSPRKRPERSSPMPGWAGLWPRS